MASQTVPAPPWLNDLVSWNGNPPDINQVLTTAFEAEDYLDCIKNLKERGIEPLLYINSLDNIIDSAPVNPTLRRQGLRALRKTCGLYGILPDSYIFICPLSKPHNQRPFTSGGFCDVWRLTDEINNEVYAVKSLRVYEQDPVEHINKRYCKEVIVFKRVNHPNVLSVEGVAPKLFDFCMVSRWMINGNILNYVRKNPAADRLELLLGVTRGLGYLHHNEVVHGDLKGSNILIDADGSPRISDYGLSSITKNDNSVNASTPDRDSTIRYCAPELFATGGVTSVKKRPTNKSDVYSLSMVIVELVTGKIPFPELMNYSIPPMIIKGVRPSKPGRFDAPGTSKAVWEVAEKCWHSRANKRPEVKEVLQHLDEITNPVEESSRLSLSLWKQRLRDMFD